MQQVLIVEDDPYFSGILVEVLKAEGFEVLLRDRADSALIAARQKDLSLLLIDQDLPDRSGLELIKELRREEQGPPVPVILMSTTHGRDGEHLRRSLESLNIALLLPKPFTVLDLPARIHEVLTATAVPAPLQSTPLLTEDLPTDEEDPDDVPTDPSVSTVFLDPEAPTVDKSPADLHENSFAPPEHLAEPEVRWHFDPPAGAMPDLSSLQLIAEIWAQQKDGILRMLGEPEWLTFSNGEPMDRRDAALAEAALYRPGVTFTAMEQEASSSAAITIAHGLLEAARRLSSASVVENSLDRELHTRAAGNAAYRLDIDPAVAGLLFDADQHKTLRELLQESETPLAYVTQDLGALLAMNLVKLGRFKHTRRAPEPPKPRPISMADPAVPSGSSVSSPLDLRHALDPSAARPKRRPPQADPPVHIETIQEAPGVSDPSSTLHSYAHSGVSNAMLSKAIKERKAAADVNRMRKELERLEGVSDWTVLSLAPNSDRDRIELAGERMLKRYTDAMNDPEMPDEGRRHAARLLAVVRESLERVSSGRARDAIDPNAGKTDAQLAHEHGLQAAADGNWDRAVQAFSAANKMELDSPETMGWLGWAIYKQAKRADYKDEALEMLQMADQFDSSLLECQYFLAVLEASSDLQELAHQRLQAILDANPDHDRAKTLFKKLDRRLSDDSKS